MNDFKMTQAPLHMCTSNTQDDLLCSHESSPTTSKTTYSRRVYKQQTSCLKQLREMFQQAMQGNETSEERKSKIKSNVTDVTYLQPWIEEIQDFEIVFQHFKRSGRSHLKAS